jgi:DNA-binding beta-propeller fold protein YncE
VQPIAARALHTLTIRGYADFVALEGDDAWVTNEGRVEKLRAGAPAPVASVAIAEPCGAMAVDFGSLWVIDCKSGTLVRIGVRSHRVEATIATGVADPSGELSVATGAGSVWLLSDSTGVLSRVDPRTNEVVAKIRVPAHSFAAVFGFDAVWLTTTGRAGVKGLGSVTRVDPRTNRVLATIPVGPTPRFLAAGVGGVWTLNQGDGTVTRIDPRTNRVATTIDAGVAGPGGDIAAGAGRVWVRAKGMLLQAIDPATNRIVDAYGPSAGSGAVRAGARFVWVTAHDVQKVWVLPAPPGADRR